jgi:hypothetical protein
MGTLQGKQVDQGARSRRVPNSGGHAKVAPLRLEHN